jgi:CHAT domain-containing protein
VKEIVVATGDASVRAQPGLKLPLRDTAGGAGGPLPGALRTPGSRADGSGGGDLLGNVRVKRTLELAPASRSEGAPASEILPADAGLLALEAEDGTTIFIRADALAEQLGRSRPDLRDDDGMLDFALFRDARDTRRGALGWIWRRLTELELVDDAITGEAKETAFELLGGRVEERAVAWASRKGAQALMATIENRLAGPPGLYAWQGGPLSEVDRLKADDRRLVAAAAAGTLLVFIHGTGSHTPGSFGDLPASSAWGLLKEAFGERIFGFEHRTFSEGPIDNALALAEALPEGSRLCLVTHSRGGLVGDLMCLDAAAAGLDEMIEGYRHLPRANERNAEVERELDGVAADEQAKLRRLVARLREKNLQVERYVRVAAPARGTALLSDNLDLFLSGLLNLVRRFGAWGAGVVATPVASTAAKEVADRGLRFLTRVVLEIADKRLQPQVVPGIEAMLPESPMGTLLGRAAIAPQVRMAVIAGDIESDRAGLTGLIQRIGVMFVDWAFFDRARNDLVVDTDSMYGGLIARAAAGGSAATPGAEGVGQAAAADAHYRAVFVQGAEVNHFSYFRDCVGSGGVPLPRALGLWLTHDAPQTKAPWAALSLPASEPAAGPGPRGAPEPRNSRPVLVFLPGIMGSHLAADGDRIWLDPLDLARGRLSRIAMGTSRMVSKDGLVRMGYGSLAGRLEGSHLVIRHDYDWRQPIRSLGKELADALRKALAEHPDQPVRILAHSMGGLVVRAAFAADDELWPALVARPGGRLLMLGTPNHGSHLFVESLLGQSDTVRTLARLDLRQGMQAVLDIVAAFPGAVHLLPAPGFEDTAGAAAKDYYRAETWEELAAINDDFWFGRHLAGKPAQAVLDEAAAFWRAVGDTRWIEHAPDRVAYVFGQADNTPCGILLQTRGGQPAGVMMRGTTQGDGSVTWKSGRIPNLPDERCWYMPVDHAALTRTERYFDEIESLLVKGVPVKLGRLPVSRGEEARAPVISYRPGPPPAYPTDAEIVARALGGQLRALPQRKRTVLKVAVKAMDLRFVQAPILCGHYRGDPIAGAEAVIDRCLVDGALSHRQRLGIHAAEIGQATVVLMPRTRAERQCRRSGRGALVVGLGEMGGLGADGVTEAVRAGVVRFLLHASDRAGEENGGAGDEDGKGGGRGQGDGGVLPLRLASLLIGTNSAARLEIDDAVKAVVLGVLMANRDFARRAEGRGGPKGHVAELELIELYRDTAISAAYAVRELNKTLAAELGRLDAALEVATELKSGDGVRQRLSATPFADYWPRLAIVDDDRDDSGCGPQCWTPRLRNPIPPETVRQLLILYGYGDRAAGAQPPVAVGFDAPPLIRHAERFRFTYMGEKARAEAIVQQRQPGLVEKLADEALTGPAATRYARGEGGFGHTLFQLLVPIEFKTATRKTDNLIVVVDEGTANLPWELLEADGRPLVSRIRMVRQFMTTRFRRDVIRTEAMSACVIADPSTEGYHAHFDAHLGGPGRKPNDAGEGRSQPDRLPSLDGAAREGDEVGRILETAGYAVSRVPPDSMAGDVFSKLFARPHRIVAIAAHGIYGKRGADGQYRSGVVLSDGMLLSAAEIGLMETVPDLVFLSCCHLGKVGAYEGGNRLAASLARELIEMGVRCVVAAGWEVRDDAALTFASTFFTRLAVDGARFGEAVFRARQAALDAHPDCNTWAAYQAYGDPTFQLTLNSGSASDDAALLAPEELLDWLEQRGLDARPCCNGKEQHDFRLLQQRVRRRLGQVPPDWGERPDVQQTLGRLYGGYGTAGFDEARAALLRAIEGESAHGVVEIGAIERLVKLEVDQAERLSRPGDGQHLAGARKLIDDAIARITALIALASVDPDLRLRAVAKAVAVCPNRERQAVLGSACRCQAIVRLRAGEANWKAMCEVLRRARDAFARGEGDAASADWDPCSRIQRLLLDAVLGSDGHACLAEAKHCEHVARTRFERDCRFPDAAMSADAALAAWLASATLPGEGTENAEDALVEHYRDSLRMVTGSPPQAESVLAQLGVLAEFIGLRGGEGDDERARVLTAVAMRLGAA